MFINTNRIVSWKLKQIPISNWFQRYSWFITWDILNRCCWKNIFDAIISELLRIGRHSRNKSSYIKIFSDRNIKIIRQVSSLTIRLFRRIRLVFYNPTLNMDHAIILNIKIRIHNNTKTLYQFSIIFLSFIPIIITSIRQRRYIIYFSTLCSSIKYFNISNQIVGNDINISISIHVFKKQLL